ncbi:MAG: Gx transporter family protein [Ruminococcus sp.]|nr:Gx transporter family protein [Ruminococcus sp.]
MVQLGLYTAIALTIFILEAQLPPVLPAIPGIKPGLANIVTLFLLSYQRQHPVRDALLVLLARIFLGSFFTGQMMSLLYSLAGGILSFGVTLLCSRIFKGEVLWFTGIAGGVFHNIGQIGAAAVLMQTSAVLAYLPYLILGGMAAGLLSGLAAGFFVKRMRRISDRAASCQKKS